MDQTAPPPTPDSQTLQCIAVENNSDVDMVLTGPTYGAGRISACSGMSSSASGITGPWSLQVGRADSQLAIDGPVLASFDSSQLIGEPPYLVEVVINSDLSATISQRASLPEDATVSHC